MPLYLHIDPGNGLPVYLQIVHQVRPAVGVGILKPGEQLPRSSSSPTNSSSTRRPFPAPARTRAPGIRSDRPGQGAFVRDDAGRRRQNRRPRRRSRKIDAAVREARSLGVDQSEGYRMLFGRVDRCVVSRERSRRSTMNPLTHRPPHQTVRPQSRLPITDLSLSIAPGSVFGLLGRNGAGKSTAINCTMGLIAKSEGSGRTVR